MGHSKAQLKEEGKEEVEIEEVMEEKEEMGKTVEVMERKKRRRWRYRKKR